MLASVTSIATDIDMDRARERLAGLVHKTPVVHSRLTDARTGLRVWFKAESLQRSGSFKIRGALNAALAGLEAGDRRGLLAVSSGNHGQAIALAAQELGLTATIVMPEGASPVKAAAARAYGATVVSEGVTGVNREEVARQLAEERNLRFIHPHGDAEVIAGQSTVAQELAPQLAELGAEPKVVLVPVGGGGLISGIALAAERLWPSAKVIGVEPANGDDGARSLAAGRMVTLDRVPETAADGARTLHLGQLPWEVIREHVPQILTVTDQQLAGACWWLWSRTKLVVEPTGALSTAALLEHAQALGEWAGPGDDVVCVISGGNCQPSQISQLTEQLSRLD